MFPRRLWTQAPRVPRTVTAQSWSTNCLSHQIHGKAWGLYRGANLQSGFPEYVKRRHFPRAYSNFSPRGPPPYYNRYSQPPTSRTSRLKDMAIGSLLVIMAYLAYESYKYWEVRKEMKEREQIMLELDGVLSTSEKLLAKAEAENDGSPESLKTIRTLFKERAMGIARLYTPRSQKDRPIIDLGPLYKLPPGDEFKSDEVHELDEDDTVMLMPPSRTVDEFKRSREYRAAMAKQKHIPESVQIVTCCVIVAVNLFAQDFRIPNITTAMCDARTSRLQEIIRRMDLSLSRLHEKRRVGMPIMVKILFRDQIIPLIYNEGDFIFQ